MAICLVVVLMAIHGIYRQVKDFDMLVYDDFEHIVYNPGVVAPQEKIAWTSIWGKPYFDLYVPVAYTMWALVVNHTISSSDRNLDPLMLAKSQPLASALHTTNLYLHELCTILVYVLLLMVGMSPIGSAIGTLVFALHPLQVESVAWISEGRGLLAAALGLTSLTLWLWSMRDLELSSDSKRRQKPYLVWSGLGLAWCLFIASTLAKPSTVILPAIGGCLAYWTIKIPLRRIAVHFIPWVITGLLISGMTGFLQKDLVAPWSWWERGLLAIDSFFFYLHKVLWPSSLLPDYGRQPNLDASYALGLLVATMALLGVVFLSLRQRRTLGIVVGLFIFSLSLSPHLGILPSLYQSVSTVADRYAYLALVGPAYGVALTWTWEAPENKRGLKVFLLVGTAVWLGILVHKTMEQLPLWRTTETLFQYNLAKHPASFTPAHALGDLAMIQGNVHKAADYYRRAIEARPLFAQGYASLGHALLDDKKPQEAKQALRQAITINNQNPSALLNLGVSLQRTGDVAGAMETYLAVNALNPHPLAYFNLGSIYLQQGSLEQAESCFLSALRLNPRLHQAHSSLALIYDRKGRLDERDQHLQQATRLKQTL
jgi:tetratricopeptide (TPR) repeat protein